jgi:hypothetical protein
VSDRLAAAEARVRELEAALRATSGLLDEALTLAGHVYGFAYHEANTRYVRGRVDDIRARAALVRVAERAEGET